MQRPAATPNPAGCPAEDAEIIETVHARRAPMTPVSGSLRT
jgi:hypothetical protein